MFVDTCREFSRHACLLLGELLAGVTKHISKQDHTQLRVDPLLPASVTRGAPYAWENSQPPAPLVFTAITHRRHPLRRSVTPGRDWRLVEHRSSTHLVQK